MHMLLRVYVQMYVYMYVYICIRICAYKCVYVSDDAVDFLIDYFKMFAHKLCCFDGTHHLITKLLSTADVDKVSIAALIISCDA